MNIEYYQLFHIQDIVFVNSIHPSVNDSLPSSCDMLTFESGLGYNDIKQVV
jgi:hypothetical protein